MLENDLIEPILLKKSRGGFEAIAVQLPERPFLANNQFFVAIDRLDSGVTVLTDHTETNPFCASDDDRFYNQLLKKQDGSWYWEKFSYAIDVAMEYTAHAPRNGMSEVAASMGVADTLHRNGSFAWADVDQDGYLDLLWDGRLYANREGKRFERVFTELTAYGTPLANLFIDANNDGDIDILFLGFHDTSTVTARLFLNKQGLDFTPIDLAIPLLVSPTSFSVADVDGDGFLDLFVGQSLDPRESAGRTVPRDLLLLNTAGTSFLSADDRLPSSNLALAPSRSSGSQFLDPDNDGDPDLYIARRFPDQSTLALNDGSGRFAQQVNGRPDVLHELGAGTGGDWKDYDNDGDLDLLYPRLIHPYLHKYRSMSGSGLYVNRDNESLPLQRIPATPDGDPIEYEERHASGTWGDVDNDGLLDAFFTTAGDCRFAELYSQNRDHSFRASTFDYGLHWSSAGEDAVWVDFDNDGWLDLCTIEWNRLRLYKNMGEKEEEGGYVEIEPIEKTGSYDIGATVVVYTDGMRISRDVTVGRGLLVGDPPRLHFGLGRSKRIDSVDVEWSDGTREVFSGIESNAIVSLIKGSSGTLLAKHRASISAVPNPFADQLHIYFSIPNRQPVRLAVYDRSGNLVASLLDEVVDAGNHTVTWDAKDGSGFSVPSGLYIYRLLIDGEELHGQAMLTK